MDRAAPSSAKGGMMALTRDPSGKRASTMGLDSSTRRPMRDTILSMMRIRCSSSVNLTLVSSNFPLRSTNTVEGPLTRISEMVGSASNGSRGPNPMTSFWIAVTKARRWLSLISRRRSLMVSSTKLARRWRNCSSEICSIMDKSNFLSRSWWICDFKREASTSTRCTAGIATSRPPPVAGGGTEEFSKSRSRDTLILLLSSSPGCPVLCFRKI